MLSLLLATTLTPRLDAVLDVPELKGSVVAALVQDSSGRTLYERNPSLRVVPASNQKLLSCAFALTTFGPDYRPTTRIWVDRDRLIVEANGDPSLTYAQLKEARARLNPTGRFTVHVKQGYRVGIPDTWEVDDLPNRYAAPVFSFSFDQSAAELWAEKGRAFVLPEPFGIKIRRDSKLAKNTSRYDIEEGVIYVSNELPTERTRLDTIALKEGDRAAAAVLGRGFSTIEELPSRAPDMVIQGKPMIEIVRTCLTRSDNNIAENLMLMAAAHEGSIQSAPYRLARERLTNFLTKQVGVAPEDLKIYDGSGMSRHNLVTVRGLVTLLQWMDRQPTAPQWRESLAGPGIEGTLKNRLAGIPFRGKTGTLDMVVALSGQVTGKDGRTYYVSLVLNHVTSSSAKTREIVDGFIKAVSEESFEPNSEHRMRHAHRPSDEGLSSLAVHWISRPHRDRGAARAGTYR